MVVFHGRLAGTECAVNLDLVNDMQSIEGSFFPERNENGLKLHRETSGREHRCGSWLSGLRIFWSRPWVAEWAPAEVCWVCEGDDFRRWP